MSVGNDDGRRISLRKAMELGDEQTSIGKQNKERIHRFMIDAYPEGKSVSELVNYTKRNRDTIYEHLRVLLREKKVEKIKVDGKDHRMEYRVTDSDQVSKEGFARGMRSIGKKMIYPIWLKPDIIAKNPIPEYTFLPDVNGNVTGAPIGYDYYPSSVYGVTKPEAKFYEKMSREDVTVSRNYCQTKFSQIEKKERYVFEFVNRVGAFIMYIFIESLKALSEKSNDDNPKTAITKLIIDNAIDLNGIFGVFCNLFEKQNPKEISKAFKNVYPAGEILVKYWSDFLQLSRRFKKEHERKIKRDKLKLSNSN
jgi:hypothetical protein